SRLRAAFGVELALKTMFETPTAAGIAAAVRRGEGVTVPALVPQARAGKVPLSYAQQRLGILDQLEPGSALYKLPVALRLKGELDVAGLERAANGIVARHEALRTTFVAEDGEPVQKVHATGSWPITWRDGAADVVGAAAEPFDLANGPLVRATVWR